MWERFNDIDNYLLVRFFTPSQNCDVRNDSDQSNQTTVDLFLESSSGFFWVQTFKKCFSQVNIVIIWPNYYDANLRKSFLKKFALKKTYQTMIRNKSKLYKKCSFSIKMHLIYLANNTTIFRIVWFDWSLFCLTSQSWRVSAKAYSKLLTDE